MRPTYSNSYLLVGPNLLKPFLRFLPSFSEGEKKNSFVKVKMHNFSESFVSVATGLFDVSTPTKNKNEIKQNISYYSRVARMCYYSIDLSFFSHLVNCFPAAGREMSVRGGGGQRSCSPVSSSVARAGGGGGGLQPLRATVPFQLQLGPADRDRNRDSGRMAVERTPCQQISCIRRTFSLDAIVVPYLLGQWPCDVDTHYSCLNEKATQTPSAWLEAQKERSSACLHKRSASWGSTDHLREIAKLRQQLQRSKLCGRERERNSPIHGDHALLNTSQILDVPDGHRAPVPSQRCCSNSQSDPFSVSLTLRRNSDCSSLSPTTPLSPHPFSQETPEECSSEDTGSEGMNEVSDCCCPIPKFSASPKPNHSYLFKREPPEGCERVKVFEEALSPSHGDAVLTSCPDKNKVHFIPTGSAFCPVTIFKPLLPTMDLILRSLPQSAALANRNTLTSPSTFPPCQAVSNVTFHHTIEECGVNDFSELSKPQTLQYEPWKCAQNEEGPLIHSSLVV
ncbi:protein FAM117A isoform X2 [Latimeria chalumnae]|uniref:protein FAM117A isoform X2 n=1 Tax=Latimeria chalumnae TaxID=7897 RepID=UPI0003C17F2F|nr:PREDICTED: protein FAM117A isoform X2 [Latimeria chalumnae]|eukprot:XP_014346816.1 PREDICTED: protein FAM117A isoform X2 [Latimeria chalumnae]